jgi:hypothetical protein
MKRAYVFFSAFMTACVLHADPSVNWVSDSYTSFDVKLSGTGPGWSGTITSPNGLWELFSGDSILYPTTTPPVGKVEMDLSALATFLGPLPAIYTPPNPSAMPPYNTASLGTDGGAYDFYQPAAPINDGAPMGTGYLKEIAADGWVGEGTFSVTSIPDVNDTSTWTWSAEWEGSGPSLETPEPGPAGIELLGVGLALGALAGRRYSRRTACSRFPNEATTSS